MPNEEQTVVHVHTCRKKTLADEWAGHGRVTQ